MTQTIVLAGATGDLGLRIARALIVRGAGVRALVRPESNAAAVGRLRDMGVAITPVHFRTAELTRACEGATCVVSALSGLEDTIVDAQSALLGAAIDAGCERFFPSDFALDYTKLPRGTNRNLDLRRRFRERLDRAPIAATSILNGAFTDLLIGPAPLILPKIHRVLYFGDADQPLDFTTRDDTAAFTADTALSPSSPRDLHIAGDRVTARELAAVMSDVTGREHHLLRGGDVARLDKLIWITKKLAPGLGEVFPPWQGMQYTRDMFDGRGLLEPLDNDRYGRRRWTSVREVLASSARGATVERPAHGSAS